MLQAAATLRSQGCSVACQQILKDALHASLPPDVPDAEQTSRFGAILANAFDVGTQLYSTAVRASTSALALSRGVLSRCCYVRFIVHGLLLGASVLLTWLLELPTRDNTRYCQVLQ